jgi:uncharacterized protein (DUF58 family)
MRSPRFPFAPTRRLALVVLATAPLWLASGTTAGRVVALGALLLLAAVAAVDAALAPDARRLTATRDAPRTMGQGDEAEARYVVALDGTRAARATLHDLLPASVERLGPAVLPLALAPGGETVLPVRLRAHARGRHALGPLALRVDGPLGLVRRTVRWAPDDEIAVAPSVAGVQRYRLLSVQHRLRDAGVRQLRRRGAGTVFAALREYVPGDDPRGVDWKASARRDTLLVRERAAEQGQTVVIAVDAGRLMTQAVTGGGSRFDAALAAALVLADVAAQGGDRVGLLVFDDAVRAWVPPTAGPGTLGRLRDTLVDVQPSLVESDYAAAFRALAERQRRRALLVLYTDVVAPRASRALVALTGRAAARHLPLVVALRDEALDAAADPRTRDDAIGVYESAAAEELLQERAAALTRMRHAGADVVDVPTGALAAAVVNRYLALKARGAT